MVCNLFFRKNDRWSATKIIFKSRSYEQSLHHISRFLFGLFNILLQIVKLSNLISSPYNLNLYSAITNYFKAYNGKETLRIDTSSN